MLPNRQFGSRGQATTTVQALTNLKIFVAEDHRKKTHTVWCLVSCSTSKKQFAFTSHGGELKYPKNKQPYTW